LISATGGTHQGEKSSVALARVCKVAKPSGTPVRFSTRKAIVFFSLCTFTDSVKQSEVRVNNVEHRGGPAVMDRHCLNFDSSTRSSGRVMEENMTPLENVNSYSKIRVN
jgi:hypothetical protein